MSTPLARGTQHGTSMIEVLLAIVILSFGLLAMAASLSAGFRANQSAYYRTIATQQAYDMSDRLRANLAGVNAGNYLNLAGIPADPGCEAVNCTPAQIAQYDAFSWNTANAAVLPSGAGVVCVDSTPNDGTPAAPGCDGAGTTYAIKVWWDDNRNGNLKLFVVTLQP